MHTSLIYIPHQLRVPGVLGLTTHPRGQALLHSVRGDGVDLLSLHARPQKDQELAVPARHAQGDDRHVRLQRLRALRRVRRAAAPGLLGHVVRGRRVGPPLRRPRLPVASLRNVVDYLPRVFHLLRN